MDTSAFEGTGALVTGAASGIGLALSRALVRRGARVWMTDIDGSAVEAAAAAVGGGARAGRLDVRDAPAFRDAVAAVVRDAGRIGWLFNNAGIGVGGPTESVTLDAWNAAIDVNLRGVVNGVAAAYPTMVAQRCGHIVNTASTAGLLPVPLLVPYATTKHAVVGLSTSLRIEAAAHGVRVSALCPGPVDTPLLDVRPDGAPSGLDTRAFLTRLAGEPMRADALAEAALDAAARDVGVIVLPARSRATVALNRWAPGLVTRRVAAVCRAMLAPPGR